MKFSRAPAAPAPRDVLTGAVPSPLWGLHLGVLAGGWRPRALGGGRRGGCEGGWKGGIHWGHMSNQCPERKPTLHLDAEATRVQRAGADGVSDLMLSTHVSPWLSQAPSTCGRCLSGPDLALPASGLMEDTSTAHAHPTGHVLWQSPEGPRHLPRPFGPKHALGHQSAQTHVILFWGRGRSSPHVPRGLQVGAAGPADCHHTRGQQSHFLTLACHGTSPPDFIQLF